MHFSSSIQIRNIKYIFNLFQGLLAMFNAPHKMPVWTKMRTDVTDALDVNNNSVHKLNNKSSK